MKSVLISIRPKWCELIASGNKTLEIRKTRPKLETPFRCYIYCTKPSKKYQTICGCMILNSDELYRHPTQGIKHGYSIELMACDDYYSKDNFLNGKVIGEFVCNEIECFTTDYRQDEEQTMKIASQSCVNISDLEEYEIDASCLYAWHISKLIIYDKPKELSEFNITDNQSIKECVNRYQFGQPECKTAHGGWIKGSYYCTIKDDWCNKCKTKPAAIMVLCRGCRNVKHRANNAEIDI